MIKNKKDYIASLSRLRDEDSSDLKFAIERLQKIVESSTVSEDSTKELYSVISLLLSMYQKFSEYILLWTKQGFIEE